MKVFYLDYNFYIYALSDPTISHTINSCKKTVKFAYSPAHIEEVHKALVNKGESYFQTANEILESIAMTTNSLELLPSPTGIIYQKERPIDCYRRVSGVDTTERIETDSKRKFESDADEYHRLLAEDKHHQSISTFSPEKIWDYPIIKKAVDDLNRDMPQVVQRQNQSYDTFLCFLLGADKRLPIDLQFKRNSFLNLKASHTQLEFVMEVLFRILSYYGYNTDKSESKAVSGTHDVTHAIYATETDKFFTTDERFAQRCRAVYSFLGVPTQVVSCKPKQIITTLQNSI